ncbi:MAG: hypothetical protein MUF18_09150 [Fimbriiglobus sp.]|jgi:hypothetical protein|nr:hypothetical protein [Fimbriiglobus sp.]
MVVLWANGQVIDRVSEAELGPRLLRCTVRVELRDDDGRPRGEYAPREPIVPWDPSITEEEVQRRLAEPGFTFEEVQQKLGWV